MKHKFEELKAKIKSKVEKTKQEVKTISYEIKRVLRSDSSKVFLIECAIVVVIARAIKRIRIARWGRKFLNRNHYQSYLGYYEVDNSRLTVKNCKKYQKLIDKGLSQYEALVKSRIYSK